MSSHESTRFPKRVLARYAEIVLRYVHQAGGRDRFVSVLEIEEAVGIEEYLVLWLCRTRLKGEIQVADRLPVELKEDLTYKSALEREWIRCVYSIPHVRVRPEPVRLTEAELLDDKTRRKKSKKKKRKKCRGSRA